MSVARYVVIGSGLRHNGIDFPVGTPMALDSKYADPLVAISMIQPQAGALPTMPSTPKPLPATLGSVSTATGLPDQEPVMVSKTITGVVEIPELTKAGITAKRYEDMHKRVVSRGRVVCNWRDGTFTNGGGCGIEAGAYSPSDSSVAYINGGASGNFCTQALAADISVAGVSTIGVWAMVPARSSALKDYRSCPLKFMIGPLVGWTNYAEFTFNARADGKWHFYVLDTIKANITGTFSFAVGSTNVIGNFRVRASWDNGTNASASLGTDPLQTGEKAYIGGIMFNPRSKAAAMVRWDDNLAGVMRKDYTLAADYVGASGVTVPAGSYSGYELCEAFGHKAAMFILTSLVGASDNFLSVDQLLTLQKSGWEICFQTHANPRDLSGRGMQLLGPAGYPWYAQQTLTHATDGLITGTAHLLIDTFDGQTNHVTLIGAPPAPLVAGNSYWVRYVSATTCRLFATLDDSYNNTSPITFAASGTASWGWNQYGSTGDVNGALNDFAIGISLMKQWGLDGYKFWAPNQGAYDVHLQNACYANAIRGVFFTRAGTDGFALGKTNQWTPTSTLSGANTLLPSIGPSIQYAFDSDNAANTEAAARSYVRELCRKGALGQNVHHNVTVNTLSLIAYLDELKFRQDRGELDVMLPSRVCDYIDYVNLDS